MKSSENLGSREDRSETGSSVSTSASGYRARPRYAGNVTIEMIDDFFNPISKYKDKSQLRQVKFAPPSSTSGLGLIEADSKQDNFTFGGKTVANSNVAYAPFVQRDTNNNNFDYVNHLRKHYENELRDEALKSAKPGDLICSESLANHEEESVVGSGMSQIESVTTMNTSVSKKLASMKLAQKLTQTQSEANCSVGDESKLAGMIEDANQLLDVDEQEKRQKHLSELLKTYKHREQFDAKLPITEHKEKILQTIHSRQFVIIQGGTGCGKTTQVPQYILDAHMKVQKYCNIIVTQPRRIAAISVAKRVCAERNWELGKLCGYQIGLDRSKVSEDTRILYVTTGVLLQKLIGSNASENLDKYTHIVLDEVHERDLDIDFVLLILKIKSYNNLGAKIVLMSATIDSDLFAKYYTPSLDIPLPSFTPVINIPTSTFNVQVFYWEDLVSANSFLQSTLSRTYREKAEKLRYNDAHLSKNDYSIFQRSYGYNYKSVNGSQRNLQSRDEESSASARKINQHMQNFGFSMEEPMMSEEAMMMAINLLKYFDEDEVSKIKNSADYVEEEGDSEVDTLGSDVDTESSTTSKAKPKKTQRIIDGLAETRGTVLIFVPGMQHIQQLHELIDKELARRKIKILPLHSDIVIEQQVRVFEKALPTWRKVIISTSIAESSITVPDIKYVIDFGLTKELYCDPYTNYTHLRLEWASQSSMNQRRGRAGRVSDGVCYRLICRAFFNQLEEYNKPAILREPLSRVVLNVKRLRQKGEPRRILSLAIQPPKLSHIERTILLLKEVGALSLKSRNSDGTYSNTPYDGDITYVGSVMANLPIDVRLSKLILLGHTFGKLNEAIIIAAGLSTKTFFTCFFKSYLESFKAKWVWSEGWMCDCISILNVFTLWQSMRERGSLRSRASELKWAKQNMIELERLHEVDKLKQELESRLMQLNIKSSREVVIESNRGRQSKRTPSNNNNNNNNNNEPYNIDDADDQVRQNLIIKMLVAGAFYPNYFTSQPIDIQEAYKTVSYKDLKHTVQLKNLPINEGVLYHQKICEMFRICSNSIQLHFEDSKAYVEFKSQCDEVASNVNFGVYLAVQMRLLNLPMKIRRYAPEVASEKMRRIEQSKKSVASVSILFDKERNGAVKLSISSKRREDGADSDASTVIESEESDVEEKQLIDYITPKNTRQLDPSMYLSCASILSQHESLKEAGSVSRSSSMRQLASNRITPNANSIIEYLSNPKYLLPEVVDKGSPVSICISHVVECAHFWAQINDESHVNTLRFIQDTLNAAKHGGADSTQSSLDDLTRSHSSLNLNRIYHLRKLTNFQIDVLCVTTYKEPEESRPSFYRARLLSVNKPEQTALVQFVDFGNKEKKKLTELFELAPELQEYPFQAVECKLANVRMSLFTNPNGVWTKSATKKFVSELERTSMEDLQMKVYGLNESVAMVKLFKGGETELDMAEALVSSGYAIRVDVKEPSKPKPEILYVPSRNSEFVSEKARMVSSGGGGGGSNQDMVEMMYKAKMNLSNNYLAIGGSETMLRKSGASDEDDSSSVGGSYYTDDTSQYDENESDASYSGFVELRGPYSPLEVNFFPMANIGHTKKTRVERNSINYVTLDDDPFNDCARLMIAAEVTLNSSGETMILRKTSLLPKLPGLASICCLLFAPTVEFRNDEKKTMYTGALCGLGSDQHSPIYADNDIECTFDVNVDISDITMINAVRLAINLVIGSEEAVLTWTNNEYNLKQLQQRACDKLLQVIQRNRERIEPSFFRRAYRWNQVAEEDLISVMPKERSSLDGFYNYHQVVALNPKRN